VAPILNALSILATTPAAAAETVFDPYDQYNTGTIQSAPAVPSQIFFPEGLTGGGQTFVEDVDAVMQVMNEVYEKSRENVVTLSVLGSFAKASKHYLAPSYSSAEKAPPVFAVEFIGLTNYFASTQAVNTIFDAVMHKWKLTKKVQIRPFWVVTSGSFDKTNAEQAFPKFKIFQKKYQQFNCLGYFENDWTKKMFGEIPAHQ